MKGLERAAWAAVTVGLGGYLARERLRAWAHDVRGDLTTVGSKVWLGTTDVHGPREGDTMMAGGMLHTLKWDAGVDMTGPIAESPATEAAAAAATEFTAAMGLAKKQKAADRAAIKAKRKEAQQKRKATMALTRAIKEGKVVPPADYKPPRPRHGRKKKKAAVKPAKAA